MNKKLLPITLLCLLGLVACGVSTKSSSTGSSSSTQPAPSTSSEPSQPQPSSSSSQPAPSSSSSSSSAPSSSSSSSSSAPSSSSSSQPSSSSSSSTPSSSSDPIQYGVAINNKDEFNDWHAGDNTITLDITLTPAANVRAALSEGELVISSSNPDVVSLSGLVLTPKDAGTAKITATYHGQSDSVDITVKAEDIKTIPDIIANGQKDDAITFKGYYLGHNSRMNSLASDTYPYVYVGDGQQSIILYCMPATYLEGIEVGDLVKVAGKYSPYNGLPETASGSVTKFEKTTSDMIGDHKVVKPTVTTIDAAHPSLTLSMANIGSPVHVEGATVSKIVKVEAKSRTDLEPAVNGQPVTTNYYERTYKIKVAENEYDFFINERYVTPSEDITALSVGDTVSFDAFVNIPAKDQFNLAMPSNIVRVASVKDPVESLTLTAERNKLFVGTTLNLKATILPETALQTVEWASSNPAVATVADGVVTGVAAGQVTITATAAGDNTKSQTLDLEVVAQITEAQHAGTEADPYTVDDACFVTKAIEDKKFSANEVYVEGKVYSSSYSESYGNFTIWLEDSIGGKAFELYAAVLDSEIFTNEELVALYKSNVKDGSGNDIGYLVGHNIKAHGYLQHYGNTLEMSKNNNVSPTITFVSPSDLSALSLKETASIAVGGEETLVLTASPIDASLEGVVWASTNPAVATVDQTGKVTGVAAGEAVITATKGDIAARCTVTVIAGGVSATSVTLDKSTASITVVETLTLTADVAPANTTDTLEWSSSDETIATVKDGVVTPLKPGEVTIKAQAGEVKGECVVTISQTSLADFNSAKKGDKVDFYAYYVGKYNGAKGYFVADGAIGAYVYENTSKITGTLVENAILHIKGSVDVYGGLREIIPTSAEVVESHEGLAAAVKLNITAENRGSLTVTDQGRLASLTGKVTKISATPSYGKNGTSPIYTIEIASGVSIGVQLHKTNVTQAEYEDFAAKAQLGKTIALDAYVAAYKKDETDLTKVSAADFQLVNPKVTEVLDIPATAIALDKATLDLEAGKTADLVATLTPANATDVVVWSSSDETVAKVDQTGKVTGVAAGSATITAKVSDEIKATCTVTVTGEATETFKEALFAAANNSEEISSYTSNWYSTTNGFRVDIINANNNKNGWSGAIAFGSKNGDSTGSITTHEKIESAVANVVLNITQANLTANMTSIDLEYSTDGTTWTKAGSFTYAVGAQTVTVASPAGNMYYRVVFNCTKGSSNGFCRINSLKFNYVA